MGAGVRAWCPWVAGAALAAAGAAGAQVQTLTLAPVADTSIFAGVPDAETRADGSGDSLWLAVTAEGLNRRALVRFDLSALPPGARVQRVDFTLYESRARDEHEVALHRLLASWGEGGSNSGGSGTGVPAQPGDATWRHRFFPGVPWSAPGGDHDPAASAVLLVGAPNTTYTWTGIRPASGPVPRIVQDVQAWVDQPAANHGWLLIGNENALQNAKRFVSRNDTVAANRPRLTVVYEPAAAMAADADVPVPPWALLALGASLLVLRQVVGRRRGG